MKESTFVFDIDGTICNNTYGDYENAKPYVERVEKINKLHSEGNTIICFTARGMGRFNGDTQKAYDTFFELTRNQLDEWGVKYHRLILGKPSADYYVDDKGVKDEDFF